MEDLKKGLMTEKIKQIKTMLKNGEIHSF